MRRSNVGVALALAGVVVACSGSAPAPAPAAPPAVSDPLECKTVISDLLQRALAAELQTLTGSDRDRTRTNASKYVPMTANILAAACREDAWSVDVRQCYAASATELESSACDAKMSPAQVAHFKVASATAKRAVRDAVNGLPVACSEYKNVIEKLATCTAVGKDTVDGLIHKFHVLSETWHALDAASPDEKTAAATACQAATDDVNQAARATCGW